MKRRNYKTDLSDEEWKQLRPVIPPAKAGGRPRETEIREVLNGIFYLVRGGCEWRLLPHDFPPWQTVYTYFRNWKRDGTWIRIHDFFHRKLRHQLGRKAQPSAGIIDSQSVKTTEEGGKRGYDAGKKVTGRKRHILVDTMGLIIAVAVHSAGIQDRGGARLVFKRCPRLTRMHLIWADAIYAGKLVQWAKKSSAGRSRSSDVPARLASSLFPDGG